jgi:hypothetical protein
MADEIATIWSGLSGWLSNPGEASAFGNGVTKSGAKSELKWAAVIDLASGFDKVLHRAFPHHEEHTVAVFCLGNPCSAGCAHVVGAC